MAAEKQRSEIDTSADKRPDDIPLLTDIVPDPDLIDSVTTMASANGAPDARSGVEVISRVQAQNLEHGIYQKLRKEIDERITGVVREQFMPEVGSALNSAVEHIANELKSSLREMVRASVEDALQSQLKALTPPSSARDTPGEP